MQEIERPLIDVARETVARDVRDDVVRFGTSAAAYIAGYEAGRVDAIFDTRDTDGLLRERIAQLEAQLAARPVTGVVVDSADVRAMRDTLTMKQWKLNDDDLREALTAALRTATTVPLASAEPEKWRDDQRGWLWGLRDSCVQSSSATVTPLYAGIAEPAQRGEG